MFLVLSVLKLFRFFIACFKANHCDMPFFKKEAHLNGFSYKWYKSPGSNNLTTLMPLVSVYTPWKHQETSGSKYRPTFQQQYLENGESKHWFIWLAFYWYSSWYTLHFRFSSYWSSKFVELLESQKSSFSIFPVLIALILTMWILRVAKYDKNEFRNLQDLKETGEAWLSFSLNPVFDQLINWKIEKLLKNNSFWLFSWILI